MCVVVRYSPDTLSIEMAWRVESMANVKSEIRRIFDVKYYLTFLTFLTSKDDFLVAAKTGPPRRCALFADC